MSSSSSHVDLAVVGAGACGLIAALQAAEAGLEIVVLEKDATRGSNTELSSAILHACATRFQKAAGVEDSAEQMARDILEKNHHRSDPEITLALCESTHDYVHWINDVLGYEMEFADDIHRAGQSAVRAHADVRRQGGRGLIRALRAAANANPRITFVDRFPGQGLIVEDGDVLGVLGGEPGDPEPLPARKVLLATGGFGANPAMIAQYCPDAERLLYIGAETTTGEGIVWGREAGAALEHMTGYQGHAHCIVGYGTRVNPGVPLEGGIMVNLNGERFAREDVGYSEFAAVIAAQPHGEAIELFDERILNLTLGMDIMRESLDVGAIKRFESAAELARHFAIDPAKLHATLETFNAATERKHDEFGRTSFGAALAPPFYAARVTGGLAHTQGGLKVDRFGRVLRPGGEPIPNLFAGGGCAAGVSGDDATGYSSGNGLLGALGFGTVAAHRIASELGATVPPG